MRRNALWLVLLGILAMGLAVGPDLWAAPGQSPARQTVPTRTPVPPPTEPPPPAPTTPSLTQLEESLAAAWASEDWAQVISLINRILAIDPGYEGIAEKLYTAHINYGYQLLAGGDGSGAVVQFNRALEIKPSGSEALAGLQQATTPTSSAFSGATAAEGSSEPLLPDAGGRSIRLHLGAAMIVAGIFALVMIRRQW